MSTVEPVTDEDLLLGVSRGSHARIIETRPQMILNRIGKPKKKESRYSRFHLSMLPVIFKGIANCDCPRELRIHHSRLAKCWSCDLLSG